jgi:hypothetical protein
VNILFLMVKEILVRTVLNVGFEVLTAVTMKCMVFRGCNAVHVVRRNVAYI